MPTNTHVPPAAGSPTKPSASSTESGSAEMRTRTAWDTADIVSGGPAYDGRVSGGFGFDPGDPEAFKDAPLFRELQRVMSASSGPVNWELARQVGVANAVEAGPDLEPSEGDLRMLEEAVRVAELHVGRFTGMAAPRDVAQVHAVRRAGWVNANAESLKNLLEPAARRLTDAIERSAGDQLPPEMAQLSGFLRQLSPLLLGTQVGQVLGMLAQRVLGQYDIALPRSGPGQLLFVVPNLVALRARLVARPQGVPNARRTARGDPSIRVRPGMGS